MAQTHTQNTEGHRNLQTESAHWANRVKIVRKKKGKKKNNLNNLNLGNLVNYINIFICL